MVLVLALELGGGTERLEQDQGETSATKATTVHTPKLPSTNSSQSWLMIMPTTQPKPHW